MTVVTRLKLSWYRLMGRAGMTLAAVRCGYGMADRTILVGSSPVVVMDYGARLYAMAGSTLVVVVNHWMTR